MRILIGRMWMVLVIAAACQTRLSAAEEGFLWVSGDGNSATLVSDEKPAAPKAPCTSCGEAGCDSCNSCDPCAYLGCEGCPRAGIVGIFGMDSFKGISDGSYQSNFGALAGVNAAVPLLGLGDHGFGWQLGMTYGVYDLDGRSTDLTNRSETQQQTFVTTGFFRKGDERSAAELRLGLRLDAQRQLGRLRHVAHLRTVARPSRIRAERLQRRRRVRLRPRSAVSSRPSPLEAGPTSASGPSSQVNVFWHHKFCSGADSWLWVGAPEQQRLNGDGSLGDWIVGANVASAAVRTLGPVRQRRVHASQRRRRRHRFDRIELERGHGHRLVLRRKRRQPLDQRQVRTARTCRWPTTAPSWSTRSPTY